MRGPDLFNVVSKPVPTGLIFGMLAAPLHQPDASFETPAMRPPQDDVLF
jgi:hypothetical protein